MKKYFLLVAAAATVLAVSCAKEKNQPTTDPTPQIEDNTPQTIRFGTNVAEVKAPLTKAAITQTPNDTWTGKTVNIYGFQKANSSVAQLNTEDEVDNTHLTGILINNKPFTVAAGLNPVEKSAGVNYQYGIGDEVYSFYGYYIGKEPGDDGYTEPNPTEAATGVTLDVTIDGKSDIMLASTDKFGDYAEKTANFDFSQVYSAKAVRKGVNPNLIFKHQLSNFVFKTQFGSAVADSEKAILIKSLTVNSINKGTLTIARPDDATTGFAPSTAANDRADLELDGVPAAGVNPGACTNVANLDDETKYTLLGQSLMVVPEKGQSQAAGAEVSVYTMKLTVQQAKFINSQWEPVDGTEKTTSIDIDFRKVKDTAGNLLAAGKQYAEAGKQYVVNIIVYGIEDIKVKVTLTEWEDGGSTIYDPDADDRADVTISNAVLDPAGNIQVGGTATISATATYGTSNTAIDVANIQYTSSNPAVASVNVAAGVCTVTGKKEGTCKIYVYVPADDNNTYKSQIVAVPVTVVAGNPQVEITCADVEMTIGGAEATLAPTFSAAYTGAKTYSTNAPAAVFTINENDGVITWGANPVGGVYTVTIHAGADANFSANTKDVNVSVIKMNNTLAVSETQLAATVGGETPTFTITNVNGGAVTYSYKDNQDDPAAGIEVVATGNANEYKITVAGGVATGTYWIYITSAETDTVKSETKSIELTVS